jgi:diguanylate cyclase (GGDEF)-like protein
VLKQVSARLWGTTRETDIPVRIGGDEFSLLLRPIEKPSDAAAIAERIIKTMAAPFAIDGHQIQIGASVGIAVAPVAPAAVPGMRAAESAQQLKRAS